MEILFGLLVLVLCGIFFIMFMAVKEVSSEKIDTVDRIAEVQHWEYLRSLDKDEPK